MLSGDGEVVSEEEESGEEEDVDALHKEAGVDGKVQGNRQKSKKAKQNIGPPKYGIFRAGMQIQKGTFKFFCHITKFIYYYVHSIQNCIWMWLKKKWAGGGGYWMKFSCMGSY